MTAGVPRSDAGVVVQTTWAELIVATLADAGVRTCVVSPGSRSTPLVAALANEPRIATPVVIDERAAAFCALGAARVTGEPVALVCTSGTAAAHWLPALIEAAESGVPLIAITADRPPELHGAGAPQTIDQVKLFGGFVRAYLDLGPPDGAALSLRAVSRKITQAVVTACGPYPGPVHVEVPFRKPLEPATAAATATATASATATATAAGAATGAATAAAVAVRPPRLVADDRMIAAVSAALRAAQRPLLVAGPSPIDPAGRRALLDLAHRAGVVLLAETASQLRLAPHPRGLVAIDAFDPILAARARDLAPDLILQVGREPVAAAWPDARAAWHIAARWVLAAHGWPDPDSSATGVVLGDVADAARRIACTLPGQTIPRHAWHAAWRAAGADARAALDAATDAATDGEPAIVRAVLEALPPDAILVLGNSLPVRVVDHVAIGGGLGPARDVVTQRGACGIDGLVAGAAGATWTGRPVVAIIGDVSFAHDLGGVAAAARAARAPLVVVVVDNGGGRIFDGLPVAAALAPRVLASFFHTPPGLDPAAVARAVGAAAVTAPTPAAAAAAVAAAARAPGLTVVHAPVAADGAHHVRRAAITALTRGREPALARGSLP